MTKYSDKHGHILQESLWIMLEMIPVQDLQMQAIVTYKYQPIRRQGSASKLGQKSGLKGAYYTRSWPLHPKPHVCGLFRCVTWSYMRDFPMIILFNIIIINNLWKFASKWTILPGWCIEWLHIGILIPTVFAMVDCEIFGSCCNYSVTYLFIMSFCHIIHMHYGYLQFCVLLPCTAISMRPDPSDLIIITIMNKLWKFIFE